MSDTGFVGQDLAGMQAVDGQLFRSCQIGTQKKFATLRIWKSASRFKRSMASQVQSRYSLICQHMCEYDSLPKVGDRWGCRQDTLSGCRAKERCK